ncbi:MAG TPA: phosphodiester glycosidase family protein [Gemmatimonadaceae bacterium]|jgi:exopolysaccharide biosynthesis protein|nr:phosphodiester glycosidase family protein [Gemmatimonadaceae bacterium]
MTQAARRPIVLALIVAACARQPAFIAPSMGAMPFPVDSARAVMVADGVTRRVIRSATGPWTINVVYVDLDRCNAPEAVASSDRAIGRVKTSDMLAALSRTQKVVAGVNGDFFNLQSGTPTNLLVVDGMMITPPIKQPVLAFDSAGVPHIAFFTLESGRLLPFHPLQAVGGRPVLVRDSAIVDEVDTFGQASFRERNPRTAAGIARNGKRLILAVVDGREYENAGMTLRETAGLMLALGARDAINLDGGGSTTMVFADPDSSGKLRIANHPSDKEGERTVGDALAIVKRQCSGR